MSKLSQAINNYKGTVAAFFSSFRDPKGIATYKKVGAITFPAFAELFLISIKGIVDMIMVSRLSIAAIAGVGITNQPFWLLIAIFNAMNVGTTTLVSWNIGKGDKAKAGAIARQAIIFNFILGGGISALGFFGARHFMPLMIDDPQVVAYAVTYLEIICLGLAFNAVGMGITAALRGAGETKIPMYYNLASNVLHLFLNYMLIFGNWGAPRLEVMGAAVSTSLARAFAAFVAIGVLMFWKRSPIRIKLRDSWRLHTKTIKDIFAIGMPSAGEQFVIQTGLLVFTWIVASLDTRAFAAHQIAINVNMVAFSVSNAFAISNTALVGRAVGADDYPLAERYTVYSRRMARIFTAVVTLNFIIWASHLLGIYTDDPVVIAYGIPVFYLMAATQYVQSSNMCTAGALRGSGDTMYPFYASIVGIWGLRLALAATFVFVFGWGVWGAWLAFFIDQSGRALVVKRRFNSGKWKEMKAVREERMAKRAERLGE
jgi:putative MATE family efflux protein